MAVYKYFTAEAHAKALIAKGEMLLRPLSYFRAREDGEIRGDPRDGVLSYAPPTGLELTKQDGTAITLEGWRFTSTARQDDIFVYCASNHLSAELAERFESPFCVELPELAHLVDRLKARAHPISQLDYAELRSGPVDYRGHDRKPGVDWALPEKLSFIKPDSFAWQDEFRIAIGKRGAFEVENVACTLESGTPARLLEPEKNQLILRVGRLADVATLHRL